MEGLTGLLSDEIDKVEEEGSELDENLVAGMMLELEEELKNGAKLPPQASPFLTININEESCGSSFSDASATVMASVDMGDLAIYYFMTCEMMLLPELEHGTIASDTSMVGASQLPVEEQSSGLVMWTERSGLSR